MSEDETKDICEALRETAARFNGRQTGKKMTIGQILEGDDAVNCIEWLLNARKRVRNGEISADQALQGIMEWAVSEEGGE